MHQEFLLNPFTKQQDPPFEGGGKKKKEKENKRKRERRSWFAPSF